MKKMKVKSAERMADDLEKVLKYMFELWLRENEANDVKISNNILHTGGYPVARVITIRIAYDY